MMVINSVTLTSATAARMVCVRSPTILTEMARGSDCSSSGNKCLMAFDRLHHVVAGLLVNIHDDGRLVCTHAACLTSSTLSSRSAHIADALSARHFDRPRSNRRRHPLASIDRSHRRSPFAGPSKVPLGVLVVARPITERICSRLTPSESQFFGDQLEHGPPVFVHRANPPSRRREFLKAVAQCRKSA